MGGRGGDARILVVDDAPATVEILKRNLESRGYEVVTASDVQGAVSVLEAVPIDLIVTDYKMPRLSGLDLVMHVRQNCKDTAIIMITGYPSIEGAVSAVKSGAEEYLAKPFTDEELFSAVDRALDARLLRRPSPEDAAAAGPGPAGLIGTSEPMQRVFREIEKAATTTATVLVYGESGTGKELVARAIHYSSARGAAPFVPVNCGGIPEPLLESELFGHVKGAFTGATDSRAGFFQTASGGTLFLDEIGETSLTMQIKLLRVLQDGEFCMVGSTRAHTANVRIIAATNKDLSRLVAQGKFREDLYYRINVICIAVPPLRDRGNDVLRLTAHFAQRFGQELGRPAPVISPSALELLRSYHWPGNVRELENVVRRLMVMAEGEAIDAADLPELMRFSVSPDRGVNRTLAELEIVHIQRVLASVGGNKTQAARILGIDRKTLREKLKATGQDS